MFCGQCGNQISEGAKFCNKCGWKVPSPETGNAKQTVVQAEQVATTTAKVADMASEQVKSEGEATEVPGARTENVQVVQTPVKKKSKAWIIWLLVAIIILALGATATVLCIKYLEYVEADDEDDEDEDTDEEEDKSKKVSAKKKVEDANRIGTTMDALEVLSVDPAISWMADEIVYVKLTANGSVYGSDNQEVIQALERIVPAAGMQVSAWADGMEIWATKDSYGRIKFATSMELNELAAVSQALSNRFSMNVTTPVTGE